MLKAKCKWWNENKGYGFLTLEDGRDVFTHFSAIEGEGFKTLSENEEVECELMEGPKGPQATRVYVNKLRWDRVSK